MRIGISEAARLLRVEPGQIRIWRNRGICRLGFDGSTYAASYTPQDILVMEWALSLKNAGIELKTAFGIAESSLRDVADFAVESCYVKAEHRFLIVSHCSEGYRARVGNRRDLLRMPGCYSLSIVLNLQMTAEALLWNGLL
jgi:hypothetical protein